MSFYVLRSAEGLFWHGYEKDDGATWGVPEEAALFERRRTAQEALEGLSCPSAEEAAVIPAPPAALGLGVPTEATDGELEASLPARPGKRKKLRLLGRSER